MNEMDYSDQVIITITKVKYMGEPTIWDVTVEKGNQEVGGGTSPTFAGASDIAYSIIAGGDKSNGYQWNDWVEFDANKWN